MKTRQRKTPLRGLRGGSWRRNPPRRRDRREIDEKKLGFFAFGFAFLGARVEARVIVFRCFCFSLSYKKLYLGSNTYFLICK